MSALNFPNSPSNGDTYSANGLTYTYNSSSTKWVRTSPSVGAQGSSGPTGAQGAQGHQGSTGATGSTGPTGPSGATGAQGATGSTGAQGATGSTGAQGATGSTGAQGATGTGGSTGAQGAEGNFGGATFYYTFESNTSNANPGSGDLRLDNSTQNAATGIYICDTDEDGTDIASYLQTIDDSTSTIKGHVKITNKLDSSQFLLFTISSLTDNTGYFDITVSPVDSSATSPFSANEDILITFARTGDKGDTGSTGAQGATGSTGSQGATGATGAQGAAGAQGATGSTGPTGPSGATGAQGATGGTGPTGAQGATGSTGAQGALATINSNTNNYVLTATGTANTIQGESALTFNAGSLVVNSNNTISGSSIITYSPDGDVRWQMGVNNSTGADLTSKNTSGSYNTYNINAGTFTVKTTGTNSPAEALRIDGSGRTMLNNLGNATPGLSSNADDLVIGYGTQSGETGISMYSTTASGIRFNDNSGTDGAIEYAHSARELRFNAANGVRLAFSINAANSPVFNLGVTAADYNNHNKGDRTSVKVGDYLNIESARGAGHNTRAGLGYNCYFHSAEDFYCGTNTPSAGDNRPAAYAMAYGNHYFYSDATNTAHSSQAQVTMTKNMVIQREGYVTKPNQPSVTLYAPHGGQQINVAGDNVPIGYSQVEHNTGMTVSNGGSNASTRVNSRIQVPVAGRYLVSSLMSGSLNSAAAVDANDGIVWYLRKNGGSYSSPYNNMFGWDTLGSVSGQEFEMNFTVVISLAANDYLEVAYTNIHTNFNINLDKGYFSVHLLS